MPNEMIRTVATSREYIAVDLEAAIAELGRTLRAFERETAALGKLAGVDLVIGLEDIIVRHLAKAGLTRFLERKLVETPASLLDAVEQQHRKLLGLQPSV